MSPEHRNEPGEWSNEAARKSYHTRHGLGSRRRGNGATSDGTGTVLLGFGRKGGKWHTAIQTARWENSHHDELNDTRDGSRVFTTHGLRTLIFPNQNTA